MATNRNRTAPASGTGTPSCFVLPRSRTWNWLGSIGANTRNPISVEAASSTRPIRRLNLPLISSPATSRDTTTAKTIPTALGMLSITILHRLRARQPAPPRRTA